MLATRGRASGGEVCRHCGVHELSSAATTSSSDYAATSGYERNGSGLIDVGIRCYDPELGRFLQLDPLGQGYLYCLNAPTNAVDPSGALITAPQAVEDYFQRMIRVSQTYVRYRLMGLAMGVIYGADSMTRAVMPGCPESELPDNKWQDLMRVLNDGLCGSAGATAVYVGTGVLALGMAPTGVLILAGAGVTLGIYVASASAFNAFRDGLHFFGLV